MLPSPRFCGKSKAILCFFGFPLLKFSEYKAFQSDFKKVNLSLFARGSIMYEFKLTRYLMYTYKPLFSGLTKLRTINRTGNNTFQRDDFSGVCFPWLQFT